MRTKLFLAFFVVILTALLSNLIFKRLIIRDFDEYVMGTREDRLYWVLASVEGSYTEKGWDISALRQTLHWAIMFGYDAEVRDTSGKTVLTADNVFRTLTPTMQRTMEASLYLHEPESPLEEYPIYAEGKEIGSIYVRALKRKGLIAEKEAVFKQRGRDFLFISFLIAGGGALFLSFVFSMFLTVPIRRLKRASEKLASGDLTVRVRANSKDEIGELSQAFNHMVETLQREESLRKHLTSNIAHELRTPLAIMQVNIEAIIDGVLPADKERFEDIKAEVLRLINLVSAIEDATKAEASFFKKSEYIRTGLRDFLEGLKEAMLPLFSTKGISLLLEERDDFEVSMDVDRLEPVLRNILSNSLRYTDKGAVWIDYGKGKKNFFISVRDSGRGIKEEDIPKIFDRFYRGKGSEGIGLGLSIVKELVDAMGGSIEVSSKLGSGTTFKLTLPL
ncbi:MAG: HAMP domain-containing histidine kinase [Nitrospirae bacterium]|nr:HAMP domain-containing histidine kinase [Nitrospirota bacterium]